MPTGKRPETVGFDLDMTLIDSRKAVLASFAAVAETTGVMIDLASVESRLGIMLSAELAYWLPPARIQSAIEIYSRHYRSVSKSLTRTLPGAQEALTAVCRGDGRTIVVSAKSEHVARRSLREAGLEVADVFGGLYGLEKGKALTRAAAAVYVGDTPADVSAALHAGAHAVGVATGSFSGEHLRLAGADTVLESLTEFADWYRDFRAGRS